MKDSTFKPALLLMSGRAIGFVAVFFLPVVLVRIFDQAEFGTYKQLFLIYSTVYGIAQLGMAESLFYFLPIAPKEAGKYVTNSMLVLTVGGLACLGFLATTGSGISQWMSNQPMAGYITWIGIYVFLMISTAVMEIVMITRKRYLCASSSYAASDFFRAIFLVVPALLVGRLEWLLLGAVAFASLRFCAALFYLRREFPGELRPDRTLLKKQLAYALPFGIAVLVEILQSNFHQYAVSYYFDAATFAIYAVGCLQVPLVDFLFTATGNVMMVRMAEEIRDGRKEAMLRIWRDTTRKLALVFFPLVGLLILASRELIVFLFTESYRASVPIFTIWSTAILLGALQTDGVLRVHAETRFIFFLNALKLVFIVASINWFLSVFDLLGAVTVTVVAAFIGKVLALVRIKRLMQTGFRQLLPWRALAGIFVVAWAAGLPVVILRFVLDIGTLPLLVTTSLLYTGAYVVLLFGCNVLREEERLALTGCVHKLTAGVRVTESARS